MLDVWQLLEQRKLVDITMTVADDPNDESHHSNVPEKPRRKRRHFRLANLVRIMLVCGDRSPDPVSQAEDAVSHGEDHVSHSEDHVNHDEDHVSHGEDHHVSQGVDLKTQMDSEVDIATTDQLSNPDGIVSDLITHEDDGEQFNPSTNNELSSINNNLITDNVSEHTGDHVITSDDHVMPDDQSIVTSSHDSPGEH